MEARDIGIRAASAAVLAPLAIIALWSGGWAFIILMGVAAGVLAMEWGQISERRAPVLVGVGVAFAVLGAMIAAYVGDFSAALVLLVFGAVAAGLFARALKGSGLDAAYGVLYIGWPMVLLVWLRNLPDGGRWTILLFSVTWAADICAYLVGNVMRGPKLWPRFSPNKTWSGFIGGLLGGVGAALAVVWALQNQNLPFEGVTLALAALIGLLAALATMAGDLWESALKRRFGVKDAGMIIPGHGGLLDRVDGLMFAVVVVAVIKFAIDWGVAG